MYNPGSETQATDEVAKDLKKEKQFAQKSEELNTIKEELFKKLLDTDKELLLDPDFRKTFFDKFSSKITSMFPEISLFQEEGQKASEFSPKPIDVEHRKTVASLYYLLLLTSTDSPIEDKDDVRFKILVPTFFQGKFNPQVLEEQRNIINSLLGGKDKMYLMASMLAIHDLAKLESISKVIDNIREKSGDEHTSDHDVALQSLLNDAEKVQQLLPTMEALPKEKQELVKLVLKAGSEINIGQLGQALEGNISQMEAILGVDLQIEDIGFWFIENLADTASAAGIPDGSALVMSQESVWNAWKWSVESLLQVKKDNANSKEAYFNLLRHQAEALHTDFEKNNDDQIVSLRICMALQTTDIDLYKEVLQFVSREPNVLKDVFGVEGMSGEQTYRLYYSPSIVRKINQISGSEIAMKFLNRIAEVCKSKIDQSEDLEKGEVTFQLSNIDADIDQGMTPKELEVILNKNLEIDDQLYVKLV